MGNRLLLIEDTMYCPRCKTLNKQVKMKDMKRKGGFHKKTKYVCPECKLVRMKVNKRH